MKLINNWTEMYKSLAVIMPTVLTGLYVISTYALEQNIIPVEYVPFVVLISGFVGRIIKQDNIKGSS